MIIDASGRSTGRRVDAIALARLLRRMTVAGRPPWLHDEVARRMAERLPLIRAKPRNIAHWWARIGGDADMLKRVYPAAHCRIVEPAASALAPAPPVPPWWWPRRRGRTWRHESAAADLAEGAVQLVWANMMLHFERDPRAIMCQWHRVLAPEGFLMFSTFGPGSLPQLRALYSAEGWGPPLAPLPDMHDLGDMLVEAGFADPVMDQERITLSWRTGQAALSELRGLGANLDLARWPGLRTPRWRERLLASLALRSPQTGGLIELEFEVVYGHAFKGVPARRAATEATIGLEDLRATARARHKDSGNRGL